MKKLRLVKPQAAPNYQIISLPDAEVAEDIGEVDHGNLPDAEVAGDIGKVDHGNLPDAEVAGDIGERP